MAKAPVQVVLRMIFTKGTWRTYLGIYLVSIRHVPCNVSCWIFVGGKPTSMDFLKQPQKSWNAVLRWLQECLHPECLHRSCGHFGAPWGARNDSRQVQGGDYMAVPRNLRTGRCLDGVHQLLVHALIRGASEGTLPNLLYNTWPESNGIFIYIYMCDETLNVQRPSKRGHFTLWEVLSCPFTEIHAQIRSSKTLAIRDQGERTIPFVN